MKFTEIIKSTFEIILVLPFVPGSTNPEALLLMHILISRNGSVVAGFALIFCFYLLYILVIF